MSLLDDVSIVVTPNGYKARTLFGAIPVPTEGSNVVVNGDFTTDSDWTKGTGWTISGGTANCDGTQTGTTSLTPALNNVVNNVTYIVEYTISNYTSGSISIKLGNTGYGVVRSANGTYTEEIKALATTFPRSQINADASFVGSVDNVSVKEYTSADMDVTRATAATRVDENGLVNYAEIIGGDLITCGDFSCAVPLNYWVVADGNVTFSSGAIFDVDTKMYQNNIIVAGTVYKFTYEITDNTGGMTLRFYNGAAYTFVDDSVGVHTVYFTGAGTNDRFYVSTLAGTSLTLKSVSVKEVTRDNVPRIDYTGGGCPHILAEPQRTNELTQSNQFDTTWVQSGTLTSGQDGVGGSTDAWKFQNPNSTSSLYQPDTTSGVQTLSAYFKKNSNYGVRFYAFGSVNTWAYFDLNNGVVVLTGNSTAKVESVGSDWFRCSMTFDQTNTRCDFYVTNNASTQVLGNITLQYAQVEEGSYATSYIPTSGSTVTRNQDIFTRDGIGSLINSTEGVLFVEMAALSESGNYRELGLSDGTTSNRVLISYKSTDNVIRGSFQGSGGTNLEYTVASSEDFHKIAVKWKVNDFALWVDGVERATDTSGSSFPADTLNSLNFNSGAGGDIFYGKVKQLQVYKTALTDTQLAALTS